MGRPSKRMSVKGLAGYMSARARGRSLGGVVGRFMYGGGRGSEWGFAGTAKGTACF